ncbi:Formate hydrogenlyase subunit 7 (plasmid) [Klebsiella aerogenes]|nr:Formate hydrogenlyase subunit 7 [Klebsiella aerogenes]
MSNLLGPRDENGIPLPMSVDESIASMKASLLKKIKRSAYVYRVDCGGCNGCEIEIFATLSPLFDAERFGIKVVPSPRHADILLFTGAVTRAMRSPALRAWQSAPDPKICISYGACGNSGGIFHDLYCVWGGTDKIVRSMSIFRAVRRRLPPRCTVLRWRLVCWSKKSMPASRASLTTSQPNCCIPTWCSRCGCVSIAKRAVWPAIAMAARSPTTICVYWGRVITRYCAGWKRRKIRV